MASIKKNLLPLFFLLCLLNLFGEFTRQSNLIFFTKPFLLTILSLYFWLHSKDLPASFRNWMMAALIFSIGGDSLLMFVENSPGKEHFFLFGLGSFLITHLCYLKAFLNYPSDKRGWLNKKPWMAVPFLAFLIGISIYLWPDLGADLKIPVLVYSSAIIFMTLAAINLNGKLPVLAFQLLISGVLLFVLSDSLIALKKFKSHQISIPQVRILIMVFYLTGQYLIVRGSLRAGED